MDVEWDVEDEANSKMMSIDEPRVLEDGFRDTGTILMYFKQSLDSDNSAVVQLPYTTNEFSAIYTIADAPDEDLVGLYLQITRNDTPTLPDWIDELQVRYVLIPGGVPAKLSAGFFEDYEAVAEYFGLEE